MKRRMPRQEAGGVSGWAGKQASRRTVEAVDKVLVLYVFA